MKKKYTLFYPFALEKLPYKHLKQKEKLNNKQ